MTDLFCYELDQSFGRKFPSLEGATTVQIFDLATVVGEDHPPQSLPLFSFFTKKLPLLGDIVFSKTAVVNRIQICHPGLLLLGMDRPDPTAEILVSIHFRHSIFTYFTLH